MANQLPKKPRGLRKARRKPPFFALKNRSGAKSGFGAKKGPKFFVAHAGEKTSVSHTHTKKNEAGQIGMKSGEFPPPWRGAAYDDDEFLLRAAAVLIGQIQSRLNAAISLVFVA